MKKAAIYMRVSTKGQEEEETIENQRMELLPRITQDGNVLLTDCVYEDDGWSGAIIERPALDQMRADAADGKFEILYFYDRGRISRVFLHQQIILEGLSSLNIECISLHDINGKTNEERLMGNVIGLFHEYERLKITERMRIGKLRKVRENKKLLGYNPKYGYNYIPRIKGKRDGQFVINEEQAKVVRLMFAWAADGMSKYAIREELSGQGILPAKAKRKVWSMSVIDRLLRDTTYMGIHYYNKSEAVVTKNPRTTEKYRKLVKGSRVKRPQEEWLMVKVPVIIEPELFNSVQIHLARNKRTSSRNNRVNNYLVGGIIECACGFARTGDPANNSLYYRCTDRLNNACGTRQCFEHSVNAPVLDALVWNNIKDLLTQPELVFEQAKRWQEGASPLQLRLATLEERLKKLDESEARYTKMYGNGMMSEHIYKDNFSSLNETRRNVINEMTGIRDELENKPAIPLEKLVDGVIKLVEDLDFSNKKQIIQKVITKVVATKEEVTVWGHIPVLATEKVGLNVKHSYRGAAECW